MHVDHDAIAIIDKLVFVASRFEFFFDFSVGGMANFEDCIGVGQFGTSVDM